MNKNKKHQVIFIRWWDSFEEKEQFYEYLKNKHYDPYKKARTWRDRLEWSLSENFDSFTPEMPNKQFIDYTAWKIWFEKVLPYVSIDDDLKLILIWQSFWWTFLVKYLSENKLVKRIDQLHLVSPVFDDTDLVGEGVGNLAFNIELFPWISSQCEKIFIYHSTDDHLVKIDSSIKYKKLLPEAELLIFNNRWHFDQPAFMEILQTINNNL